MRTQDSWGIDYHHRHICAVKGSTVNISATYWHPDWATVQETNWLRPYEGYYWDVRLVPENSSRVTESCDNSNCILTIEDLRESDAAQYWLSFITNRGKYVNTAVPGVTLNVTGEIITTSSASQQQHHHNISITTFSVSHPQHHNIVSITSSVPTVTRLLLIADPRLWIRVSRPAGDRGPMRLSCESTCHVTGQPAYTWYRNGQKAGGGQILYLQRIKAADRFSCGLSGFRVHSPAVCESKSPC